MATRWKKWTELFQTEKRNWQIAVIFFLLSLLIGGFVFADIPYGYHPVLIILLFATIAITMVFGIRTGMLRLNHKTEQLEDEAYNNTYYKVLMVELAGCIIYIPIATAVLVFGECEHSAYSFLEDLAGYGMGWIVALIYIVPIFCSLFTVVWECERARSRRAYRREYETELEKRKALEEQDRAREEQDRAREEQNKAYRLQAELLTNITHDLKTPLTAIIGYLALMEKEELSPVMQDYVRTVTGKAEILKEMIEKILEISKASSGGATLTPEKLDLNKLVGQTLADVTETYRDRTLLFRTELTQEEVSFVGDNNYAYRILQNLLVNAVKYSLEGTRIFVKTARRADRAVLEIINTSAYPIEEDAANLKEKFVRGDRSRSTEGSGLGLAIVESYTRAMGGDFRIDVIGDTFRVLVEFELYE